MTVRGKVLLFACVSVGLVALVGAVLFTISTGGRQSMARVFAIQEQNTLYARLTTDAVWVPHALLAAKERGQDLHGVFEARRQRAEEDFASLREQLRREAEPESLPENLAHVEEARGAYLDWMRRLEARIRVAPADEVDRVVYESIHTFHAEVLPRLDSVWHVKRASLEEHRRARSQALRFGQMFGAIVPLVALVLVLALAATLLVTLHRSSRALLEGAERIGRGDFTSELPTTGPDEHAMLARAFNRMAAELHDTVLEKERLAKAEAEASEREMRRYNALLKETVRQRTAELEEANAQLLFADRLATMGQLAASVAHEINNPLAFILSNLGYAREELERTQGVPSPMEREELLSALSEAREGAERVRLLVQDLKLLSRQDDAESGPVDMGSVLRSASKMAAHELRNRARLVVETDGVPPVHGNGARLCQVFLNLLINAAHAITPGQVARNEIRLVARRGEDSRVVVEVSDTGCGIPAENLERIFKPFFTTKPVGVGSGLGLSVCHRIITSHGGDISVESVVGRGTTFRVLLPLHADERSGGSGAMAA